MHSPVELTSVFFAQEENLRREPPAPAVIYSFVEVEKANHSIGALCRVLKVSKSGFYG